jgi:MFS family permease
VFVVYLSSLVTTPYTGWLVARFGRRNFGLMAIAGWFCGILLTLIPTLPAIVGGLMIAAASGFYVQTCCQSFVSTHAKDGKSSAIGLYVTSFYIGGSFGGLLPGLLWNVSGWPGTVALVVAMLLVMAAMIRFAWRTA